MSLTERIKQRKVLQWTLAYVGAVWLMLQLVDLAARAWSWPEPAERGIQVLAWFGLLVTVVVAWHHGETGRQRVGGKELILIAFLLVAAGVAVRMLSS